MHRLIAIVLGLALVSGFAQAPALHVHAYAGHDHPDHHHGPASHVHQRNISTDSGSRIQECDPGEHATSIMLRGTMVAHQSTPGLPCDATTLTSPRAASAHRPDVADVRAHGPPSCTEAPPRAPPVICHG